MTEHVVGGPCDCGLRGWMPGVQHRPIQWKRPSWIVRDEGKMQPYVIVDHIMQGWLRTIDSWAETGASKIIVHFGIARDGRTCQYQDIYTEGIHTSSVNSPTSKIVQRLGSVARRGANPYSIAIEHEGFSVEPPYGYDFPYSAQRPWPTPMVEASIAIKRWIFAQGIANLGEPSRDSIIGHYEADARNRPHDPAPAHDRSIWPVERMIAALRPPRDTSVETALTLLEEAESRIAAAKRLLKG